MSPGQPVPINVGCPCVIQTSLGRNFKSKPKFTTKVCTSTPGVLRLIHTHGSIYITLNYHTSGNFDKDNTVGYLYTICHPQHSNCGGGGVLSQLQWTASPCASFFPRPIVCFTSHASLNNMGLLGTLSLVN